jgi:hypothetical protein
MKKLLYGLLMVLLLSPTPEAKASLSIGIGLPNVSIGINLPVFPELAPVPGYPVYYAPQVNANYFFYDGMYWVYQDDNWYASSWYNGPWSFVEPYTVPLYVLRIPVRYYQQPPVYFRGWQSSAPPRWGQHWGRDWEHRRSGWDRWNRSAAPARAPRPAYQRQYSGDRYPGAEQQRSLHDQQYRYQPKDRVVREHLKQPGGQRAPAPPQQGRQDDNQMRNQRQQGAPADRHSQPPQRGGEYAQQPQHATPPPQQRAPAAQEQRQQREQQTPKAHEPEQRGSERGQNQQPDRGQDQGRGRNNDDERGRGRDK